MANVKAQGTQVFAVIDNTVVRFSCPKAFTFGDDTFTKIDTTCLDSDTKDYERGLRDPGEGSIQIDLDDENASHLQLIELADSGNKIEWYIGSSHSKSPPTYESVSGIALPEDRIWWSFKGYINPAAPTIETDAMVGYTFTLIRTSAVVITPRTVTK
ncbi:structural protein 3 family protein [Acinetobacter sp. ANC 4558]|uniref:phage tail tube protein n=1 Tax=Acinetobacter sp. ANC 4558 TaxID=1977876 RepID=UPI000A33B992|nr:phage tail tube protein [Acinetobacter sp. ANC 4558]OTG85817.1 structural protein 3 family protein [Acinetobacter sp. ANC 4558]